MFNSILSTLPQTATLTLQDFILCTGASLVLGIAIALVYMFQNHYSKSFVLVLTLLPVTIQFIIMMVNGNLGTGVAVMGAFSLVRFRSVPGSAREIGSIFIAMAVGLATGMGFVGFATSFVAVVGVAQILLCSSSFGEQSAAQRELKITIPETLDYTGVFDDLFAQYAKKAELVRVKSSNMGSLFELSYYVVLKNSKEEKTFLDALRCRNGNLSILCGKVAQGSEFL